MIMLEGIFKKCKCLYVWNFAEGFFLPLQYKMTKFLFARGVFEQIHVIFKTRDRTYSDISSILLA